MSEFVTKTVETPSMSVKLCEVDSMLDVALIGPHGFRLYIRFDPVTGEPTIGLPDAAILSLTNASTFRVTTLRHQRKLAKEAAASRSI